MRALLLTRVGGEGFGWAKLDRVIRQVKLRGVHRVDWLSRIVATAHNLRRMQKLLSAV